MEKKRGKEREREGKRGKERGKEKSDESTHQERSLHELVSAFDRLILDQAEDGDAYEPTHRRDEELRKCHDGPMQTKALGAIRADNLFGDRNGV
jgi:hypothetical protein